MTPSIDVKRGKLFLMVIALIIMGAGVVGAEQFSYTGQATGDCHGGATVTARVYTDGSLNVPGQLLDTASGTTVADGSFFFLSGVLAANTQYDVNLTLTNAGCSPGVRGSESDTTAMTSFLIPEDLDFSTVAMQAPFAGSSPANASTTPDNTTTFTWLGDYVGVTYTLEIATDAAFGGIIVSQAGVAGLTYTLTAGQTLDDGTYHWRVRAVNGSGSTIDTSGRFRLTVLSGAAQILSTTPVNATWEDATPIAFAMTTDRTASCRWSASAGTAFASKTAFTTTGTTSHSTAVALASEGWNSIYVQCNASGVLNTPEQRYVIGRDTTDPSPNGATISIDADAAYSLDTTLDLAWAGFTDGGSGVASYYYAFTNGSGTTSGTADASSPGQLAGASQGTVTVYVWAVDAAGNIGAAATDTIVVDTLPPSYASWSTTPASGLNKYSSGTFTVYATITDISDLQAAPVFRYRIGDDSWTAWDDMTQSSSTPGSPNSWVYYYDIPEQASPDTWFERTDENLTYEVSAEDEHSHLNNVTRTELIESESTPPTFTAITDKTLDEDTTLLFNLTGSDVDLNTLTYTCNLTGETITRLTDTISRLSWIATNDHVGTSRWGCNVTDGTFTVTRSFLITVTNVNDAPVLTAIGDLYAQEYVDFNYTLNATDADDDLLAYSSNATFLSLNRATGLVTLSPFSNHRGTYRVNFTVTDGEGGTDWESISFTVGYCGDGTCRSGFEECGTCEIDCGPCDDEETTVLLLEPRNCLDQPMTIQAAKLVIRATCEEEGIIVDGKEVCGNQSDATLNVYRKDDEDSWERVTAIVTDDNGYVSFTPSEEGSYKIVLGTDDDIMTYFEVKECAPGETVPGEGTPTTPSKPTTPGTLPPAIEEPTVTEPESRWSLFTIFLYFFILPILLIVLFVSATGFAYRMARKKDASSGFVKAIDRLIESYRRIKARMTAFVERTPVLRDIAKALGKASTEITKTWRFCKELCEEYWSSFILMLGFRRSTGLRYYALEVPQDKRLHLLLVSAIKQAFPDRKPEELLRMTYQYEVRTPLDVAAMLMGMGCSVSFADPQPTDHSYLNVLLSKGLQFRTKPFTRVDVESALLAGRTMIAVVNELGERNTVIQSLVALEGHDQANFYYHDFLRGKEKVKVGKDQFMHSWKAAGSIGMVVRKG